MQFCKDLALQNGRKMPIFGIGTWQSKPNEVANAVRVAIDAGYRLVDTAQNYYNEQEIGDALEEKINEGRIKREDIFVITKLAMVAMLPKHVREQTELSLKRLKTDYIDLYLIHAPIALSDEGLKEEPPVRFPVVPGSDPMRFKTTLVDPLDTWREMEKLVDDGLVRAIGLSNFNEAQIQRIWDAARIKPANVQVECHAWFPQHNLAEFCQSKGITFTAYSPLGSPARPIHLTGEDANSVTNLLDDPVVLEIAAKYKKSPAHILLRNLMQRGISVIPKSVTPSRIINNFQVWDFSLSDEDMTKIRGIDRGKRLIAFEIASKLGDELHPFYPWPEELK